MPTLFDIREVDSASEEWRAECLSRHNDRVDLLLSSSDPLALAGTMRDEMIEQGKNPDSARMIVREALGCAKAIHNKRKK